VGFQAWAFDSQEKNPGTIARRILGRIRPGGIILLHDGSDSDEGQDRTPTLEALPLILQGIRDRGLEFFTLDRLLEMGKEARVNR
jgi:peptidoglycan/xylan/chitin deacetylase (PgdA/CDA1 family)